MLTIKHIDTDGSERIYTAERVKVIQGKGLGDDGIFLDLDEGPCCSSDAGRPSFKDVIHFPRARSSEDTTPMVYVMNQSGATVATYRL